MGGREGLSLPADFSPGDVRTNVKSVFPDVKENLERLVRIPSVSADGFDPRWVRDSAKATAEWLRESGLGEVQLLEVEGAHPAVFGAVRAAPQAPTVLLYAHHDVQPEGPIDLWESPPFEPTERAGRLFGRGTADDKAGIAVHAAALQAWEGRPPVNVVVFIDGEEEIGSAHLAEILGKHGELLRADAVVLADFSNWAIGHPALTTSLRGIIDCVVEVRVLDHAVHSGAFGGPIPDALTVLSRLIATLHDDNGDVAVNGLHVGPPSELEVSETYLRRTAGARPGLSLLGSGTLAHRLWARPAIAVLGIDAPAVSTAVHKLVPVARAMISVRLAPGDDTQRAMDAVEKHLRGQAPWGAEVTVAKQREVLPHSIRPHGNSFEAYRRACLDAWERPAVEPGTGGSLPCVAILSEAFPDAELLLTGPADPASNAHSENESVHLADLEKSCLHEALLLGYLAAHA
jgi:acetylornithine deacetylase/succinyl-diaminopimelate desuccinylase-like protein